jgi:hypothetical protein
MAAAGEGWFSSKVCFLECEVAGRKVKYPEKSLDLRQAIFGCWISMKSSVKWEQSIDEPSVAKSRARHGQQ